MNLEGDFTYTILDVDDPSYLKHDFWQVRLIYKIEPESMQFSAGEDGDEIAFMLPDAFKDSTLETERKIYQYAQRARQKGDLR